MASVWELFFMLVLGLLGVMHIVNIIKKKSDFCHLEYAALLNTSTLQKQANSASSSNGTTIIVLCGLFNTSTLQKQVHSTINPNGTKNTSQLAQHFRAICNKSTTDLSL